MARQIPIPTIDSATAAPDYRAQSEAFSLRVASILNIHMPIVVTEESHALRRLAEAWALRQAMVFTPPESLGQRYASDMAESTKRLREAFAREGETRLGETIIAEIQAAQEECRFMFQGDKGQLGFDLSR